MSPITDTQRDQAHEMLIHAAHLRQDEDGQTFEINRQRLAEAARLEAQANEILLQDDGG